MRLDIDPKIGDASNQKNLAYNLYQLLKKVAMQVNPLSEGRISAVTNASTSAPSAGSYVVGDFVRNSAPAEAGSAASKYVIMGWVCTASGSPGTWKECRCLTGN